MARVNHTQGWLGWIDQQDRNQCEWAVNYLVAHQFALPGSSTFAMYFDGIEYELSRRAAMSPDSRDAAVSLIKKMRAAWNAKKNRSKSRGRKAYSYVMSTDIEKKMRKLAGSNPINLTLEGIIDREYQLYVSDQKVFQLNLRNEKDNRERLQLQIDYINSQLDIAKFQIEVERETNKKVIATIKDLYLKLATQEIRLRNATDISTELTDTEQAEALKTQESKFEFFTRSLRSEIAAMGMRRASKI